MVNIDEASLERQQRWSGETFGPHSRTSGVLAHIRKELDEVAAQPDDISEWADLLVLVFDGALRRGFSPREILGAYHDKMRVNMTRSWPDFRDFSEDEPIEHVRAKSAPVGCRFDDNFAEGSGLCGVQKKDNSVVLGASVACTLCRPRTERLRVLRFGSGRTHLADVDPLRVVVAQRLGASYRKPADDTEALCGVRIVDGVIMADQDRRPDCTLCRVLDEKEDLT